MKTAILTDSNCGMPAEEAEALGIYTVPMPVLIGEQCYYEGIDLTHAELLQHMINGAAVSTSQPAPGNLTAKWEQLLNDGYDDMVYIPMSSGLSGSYETAFALSGGYEGKVYVTDARRISVTQRHIVLDAVELCRQGKSAPEIRSILEEHAADSIVFLGVDDIGYLKRGGRITPAAAAIASVLNIKPLLIIGEERIDSYEKPRGVKNCQKRLLKAIGEHVDALTKKGYRVRLDIAGSFLNQEDTDAWLKLAGQAFPDYKIGYYPLTCSVSCHTGPNAFGMGVSVCIAD